MSVNKEQSDAIEKYALGLWACFTDEQKIRATKTINIAAAEAKFKLANAADKHLYTLPI